MDSFNIMAATGCYQFEINHSKTKDMEIGGWITSPKFRVGQHDWVIKYFPRGNLQEEMGEYVSVFLELLRESVDVSAEFGFQLLDKHGNVTPTTLRELQYTFSSHDFDWGFTHFLERTKLEETYIKDDCFVLRVSVAVKDKPCNNPLPYFHSAQSVQHPHTVGIAGNISSIGFPRERLQKFREENKCTDVSFDVDGEIVVAHRLILAAHSPVFEAELFGSMAESIMDCIKINEMMPSVFKAMLDFMYNGSLSINGKESMSSTDFLQHLIAAADRYAVEKLKATCEYKLAHGISLDAVFSTLELAQKHNCSELKKDCLRFIADKNNSVSLMFSEGYIKLMQNYPSLLAELRDLAGK